MHLFHSAIPFFSCLIYFLLLPMPSAFTCCQALSVLLGRDMPVPQPHIYLGNSRAEDIPGCPCAAPSLPSEWFCVSPVQDRGAKEVGGHEFRGCYCLTETAAVPLPALLQPWGVYAAACLHLKEVVGLCRQLHPQGLGVHPALASANRQVKAPRGPLTSLL